MAYNPRHYEALPYYIPAAALYQDLSLLQSVENLPVEQLITQFPIEALVVTVLPSTPRFNVERFDSYSANQFRTALAVNSEPLSDRI